MITKKILKMDLDAAFIYKVEARNSSEQNWLAAILTRLAERAMMSLNVHQLFVAALKKASRDCKKKVYYPLHKIYIKTTIRTHKECVWKICKIFMKFFTCCCGAISALRSRCYKH